jgi:hypothetical protein
MSRVIVIARSGFFDTFYVSLYIVYYERRLNMDCYFAIFGYKSCVKTIQILTQEYNLWLCKLWRFCFCLVF